MASLLKDVYNKELLERLSAALREVEPALDEQAFYSAALGEDWEQMELKQRIRRISTAMGKLLPSDYERALAAVSHAAPRFTGLEGFIFPDFVEVHGLEHYECSVHALETFTEYSTSEFAVRPFIVKYPNAMMEQMNRWARHENYHVRRLASEGCRPRLPWAMALPAFKKDPAPILGILEQLKEDPSDYVRRSVANNLNDISKDHPQLVLRLAKEWQGKHPDTDWIIKHACRTLLKKCDPEALALFGVADAADVEIVELTLTATVEIGQAAEITFTLVNQSPGSKRIRLEYAIDFVKSSGGVSRKLFKLAEKEFPPGETKLKTKHSFRQMTTRVHYPGEHGIAIIANGKELAVGSLGLLKAK